MKLKIFCVLLFLFSFVLLLFNGCGNNNVNTITDCNSNRVIASFSSDEHSKERLMLLDADSNVEEKMIKLNLKPKYLVHLPDSKEPIHDLYFYVYIKDNDIYVQEDLDRMKDLENTYHLGLDNYIRKTNGITVDEFNSILTKFKVD